MDLYSRMVALLKVLLPLAALGILSTLFMLSRSVDPTANLPFSEQDVTARIRGQQVTEPFFSGTTAQGDDIIVHASTARPGGPDKPAGAENVTARIIMSDGVRIMLRANSATVPPEQDRATLTGDVHIRSTSGLVVTTQELHTSLDKVEGETPGQVEGDGPLGHITAGRMEFSAKNKGGPLHMVFKNGVKLVYDPAKVKE